LAYCVEVTNFHTYTHTYTHTNVHIFMACYIETDLLLAYCVEITYTNTYIYAYTHTYIYFSLYIVRENGSGNRFLSRVRSAAKRECEL